MPKKGKKGSKTVLDPEKEKAKAQEAEVARLKSEIEINDRACNQLDVETENMLKVISNLKQELSESKSMLANEKHKGYEILVRKRVEIDGLTNGLKENMNSFLISTTKHFAEINRVYSNVIAEDNIEEDEILVSLAAARSRLRDLKKSQEVYVTNLNLNLDGSITKLREEYEFEAEKAFKKYEEEIKILKEKNSDDIKLGLAEVRAEKREKIEEVKQANEAALTKLKNHYSDITHNNLDMIRNLKEDLIVLKKAEINLEKQLTDVAEKNKKLAHPLRKALEEIEKKKDEVEQYKILQGKLRREKEQSVQYGTELERAQWELEVLLQQVDAEEKKLQKLSLKQEEVYKKIHMENTMRSFLKEPRFEGS